MKGNLRHRPTTGFSLTEILIALTIGSVVLLGITTLFVNSSDSNRKLSLAGELMENGRYALDLLYEDVRHAGFYGPIGAPFPLPASLPDPCSVNLDDIAAAMALPIQGYRAADLASRPDLSATGCAASLLPASNLKPGSDILVVRRTDTGVHDQTVFREALTAEIAANGPTREEVGSWARRYIKSDAFAVDDKVSYYAITPVDGLVYMQAAPSGEYEVHVGDSETELSIFTHAADITAMPWKRVDDEEVTLSKTGDLNIPAENRQILINLYFVAPCSEGSGTDGVCVSGDDDIPTLKRLTLTRGTSAPGIDPVPTLQLERLAEGIEYLKVEYGIDNSPSTASSLTQFIGDGVPDLYLPNAGAPTNPLLAQWPNVVSARLFVLARSPRQITDHTDTKEFTVGSFAATDATVVTRADRDDDATNDHYKRHLFISEARINNIAGRRERPAGTY